MKDIELYAKLLGIKSPWYVKDVKYKENPVKTTRRHQRWHRFSRSKSPVTIPGNWYRVQWPALSPEEAGDRIEMEERSKDRVRILSLYPQSG